MRVDGGVSLNLQFASEAAGAAAAAARPDGAGAASASASASSASASALPAWAEAVCARRTKPSPLLDLPLRLRHFGSPTLLLMARRLIEGRTAIAPPRVGFAPHVEVPTKVLLPTDGSTKATVTSPLDFLRDSRLTAEEKLVLLLAQQQKDVEKEIEAVLKKAEAKSAQKKSGGGLLKKLNPINVIKDAIPELGVFKMLGLSKLVDGVMDLTGKALSEITGPILAAGATALGMPHLAPLAMSVGSRIAAAASDLEGALSGGEAKATANAPNAGTGSSTALDPVETQRLTLLVNRQQQWNSMVSNLLHTMHQTRMNVIQNLR